VSDVPPQPLRTGLVSRPTFARAARRSANPLVFVALPLLVAWEFVVTHTPPGTLGSDFRGTLWDAAGAVLDGRSPYPALGSAALKAGNPAVYPPLAMLLVTPLRPFGWNVALVIWLLVITTAAVSGLYLLGVRDWRVYPLVLVSLPILQGLIFGNITLLLLLGVGVAWRYRDRAGVVALAVAALIASKLFPWPLVIWLLLTRRFRAAALSIGWALVLLAVPWAAIDFRGAAQYPRLLREVSDFYGPQSVSLLALGHRLGAADWATHTLPVLGGLAVLCAAAAMSRRAGADRRVFALCMLAAIVASPIVWEYYLTLLFVPILLMTERIEIVAAFAVVLWLLLSPEAVWPPVHLPPWTTTTVAVAGLFAFVAWFVCAAEEPLTVDARLVGDRER
jgi:hypothetical protein